MLIEFKLTKSKREVFFSRNFTLVMNYRIMRILLVYLLLIVIGFYNAQTMDANGKKQGYWKKKDEKTNKLIYEGMFKDDKPVGTFKYYYPHDSIRAILNFRSDGQTASAKLFHLNGKKMAEGKYINKEIKDSTWNYFDEEAMLISKESYKNGKKEGLCMVYLPDGKLAEELNYKNGLLEGPYKKYFDGVIIREKGQNLKGYLDGKIIHYFPNGVEVAAGYYLNGKKNGVWVYKNQDGTIKEKELYLNGRLANKKETEAFFQKNKTQPSDQSNTKPKAVNTNTSNQSNPKVKK